MTDKINLALVGATSIKGEAFLALLAEANLDVGEVFLLDDEVTAGETVDFGRKELLVTSASGFDFSQVQHVILMGESDLSEQLYAALHAAGCAIIDASGFLGQRDDVSLATFAEEQGSASIIAIPEATTIQLWITLQPILQETAIEYLHVNVMQCVAQGGKDALQELGQQTAQLLNFQEAKHQFFKKQLAFNIIPQVGELTESGETIEESLIVKQLARLFVMPPEAIEVTVMWTPVFYGDVVTLSFQTQELIDMQHLVSQWEAAPLLAFSATEAHTPVTNASGKSVINLSRLRVRQTSTDATSVTFCAIADPIHLCAAATLLVLKHQLLG